MSSYYAVLVLCLLLHFLVPLSSSATCDQIQSNSSTPRPDLCRYIAEVLTCFNSSRAVEIIIPSASEFVGVTCKIEPAISILSVTLRCVDFEWINCEGPLCFSIANASMLESFTLQGCHLSSGIEAASSPKLDLRIISSTIDLKLKQPRVVWASSINSVIVENSALQNNVLSGPDFVVGGGCMFLLKITTLISIRNTAFRNCTSRAYGGALEIGILEGKGISGTESDVIPPSSKCNVVFDNILCDYGRALTRDGGCITVTYHNEVRILNSVFKNNFALHNGGSIHMMNIVSVEIRNISITDSYSKQMGGGIYLTRVNRSSVSDVFIKNSTCNGEPAGGLILLTCKGDGPYTFDNIMIVDANSSSGGAVLVADTRNAYLRNITIINSTATDNGGCLEFNEIIDDLVLENTYLQNCTCSGHGGGIFLHQVANASVSNLTVRQASSNGHGGAVGAHEIGTLTLSNVVTYNTSAKWGGMMSILTCNTTTVSHATGVLSHATEKGGALFSYGGKLLLFHDLVMRMTSSEKGDLLSNCVFLQYVKTDNTTVKMSNMSMRGCYASARPRKQLHYYVGHNTTVNFNASRDWIGDIDLPELFSSTPSRSLTKNVAARKVLSGGTSSTVSDAEAQGQSLEQFGSSYSHVVAIGAGVLAFDKETATDSIILTNIISCDERGGFRMHFAMNPTQLAVGSNKSLAPFLGAIVANLGIIIISVLLGAISLGLKMKFPGKAMNKTAMNNEKFVLYACSKAVRFPEIQMRVECFFRQALLCCPAVVVVYFMDEAGIVITALCILWGALYLGFVLRYGYYFSKQNQAIFDSVERKWESPSTWPFYVNMFGYAFTGYHSGALHFITGDILLTLMCSLVGVWRPWGDQACLIKAIVLSVLYVSWFAATLRWYPYRCISKNRFQVTYEGFKASSLVCAVINKAVGDSTLENIAAWLLAIGCVVRLCETVYSKLSWIQAKLAKRLKSKMKKKERGENKSAVDEPCQELAKELCTADFLLGNPKFPETMLKDRISSKGRSEDIQETFIKVSNKLGEPLNPATTKKNNNNNSFKMKPNMIDL